MIFRIIKIYLKFYLSCKIIIVIRFGKYKSYKTHLKKTGFIGKPVFISV